MNALRQVIAALLLAVSTAPPAQVATGGSFTLTNATVDNGGGRSAGGTFALSGTIGQTEAATPSATGGDFAVTGGFWARGLLSPANDELFSDSFEAQ